MKPIFGQQTTKVKQLADLIARDISTGKYREEDALPSINQLSRSYEVSRDTVFKAFIDLKERGMIDSTPGKGYYVVNRQKSILLLLDEYSPFKDVLYNRFVKQLSSRYKVDLWFHQYNERLFNTILSESIGRYNKYVVMNFDNEKLSSNLYKIDAARL
ncbi:MAG: winged helix-turn-helix domain-containing protein, partial [Bacteroides sp.]